MIKIINCIILLCSNSILLISQTDLEYYMNIAKKNSPIINDNQNQSKANQLEAERLKAFYTKPQIGLTASYIFSPIINLDNSKSKFDVNPNEAVNYLGYDLAAANGGQYQALLNLTQPLFNSQKLKIVTDQINVTSQINQNAIKLTGHDIEKIVTDQYILCLQNLKQIEYINSNLEIISDHYTILKKLIESSIYKQSDLSLLNIEKQNFLFQQTTYKAIYKRDLMDLRILCGINDTSNVILNEINLKLTTDSQSSFFLEKYRLDSLNLQNAKNVFELKYKPQFNIIANTGLNAVYAPTIPNRFGFNTGFSFAYNFFDGKQKNINRSKTDVLLKSVSFNKENFINQNSMRKTKILTELDSYNSRISITENQLKEYNKLLNLYKKEIITGQLSIINYITVLKNMITIQRDFTFLTSQKQSLINAYNYWNW
jgi:hypothetical protein